MCRVAVPCTALDVVITAKEGVEIFGTVAEHVLVGIAGRKVTGVVLSGRGEGGEGRGKGLRERGEGLVFGGNVSRIPTMGVVGLCLHKCEWERGVGGL